MDLSLRASGSRDWAFDMVHAAKALAKIEETGPYDLIHNHAPAAVPLLDRAAIPHVTTIHGDTKRAPNNVVFREYAHVPYVAVSRAQQLLGIAGLNWLAVVPPGVDTTVYRPPEEAHRARTSAIRPLLHVGSLGRRKGTLDAIYLAKAAARPLVIIGIFDPRDLEYCHTVIEPWFNADPQIEFLGERGDPDKVHWLQHAAALVHPLAWDEPFGLVMLEALACGIPVLAHNRGAAQELVDHGRTGFLGENWTDLLPAARDPGRFSPDACRASALRFSIAAMADGYLKVYERLLA